MPRNSSLSIIYNNDKKYKSQIRKCNIIIFDLDFYLEKCYVWDTATIVYFSNIYLSSWSFVNYCNCSSKLW